MSEIRVKVITKSSYLIGDSPSPSKNKAFPNQVPKWGRCKFLFGNECNYDWLVVYDDFRGRIELNCPSQNTILVTTEPSSIKTYETNYTKQFGYVLSGQEDWALKHRAKSILSRLFSGTMVPLDLTIKLLKNLQTKKH